MKKRLFSIIFALCFVVALSLSVSAESNRLTYTVGASAPTVSANTEFKILVKVTENTGVCWLKAVVTYDSSVLTYMGASSETSVFKDASITVNNRYSDNTGTAIVVAGTMGVLFEQNPTIYKQTGTLVELTFKVDSGARLGKTVIKVDTTHGDAVKIVGGVSTTDFTVTSAQTEVTVSSPDHTCTPGTPAKENVIEATCSQVGSYDEVTRCTVCGGVISSKIVVIPLSDKHTPDDPVIENKKDGDCKTPGTYDSVVYCKDCGKRISSTPQKGTTGDHKPGQPEVIHTPSTCTKEGSIVAISKCSVCGAEISRDTTALPIADHTPQAPVKENVVEATCTNAGYHLSVVYCSVCKAKISSEQVNVPKLGHTPDQGKKENVVEATCKLGGHYDLVKYCTVCKAYISTETVTVPATGKHIPDNAVRENVQEPVNCGADGSYQSVVYCKSCGSEISRVNQAIKAPEHTPGPSATDTTDQICLVCNTVLVPASGHTHKWSGTLTSDTVGHWYACSGCSQKKDYALHVYNTVCDEKCSVCGAVNTAGGHSYSNDCDAVCNKCGKTTRETSHAYDNDCDTTCNKCGEVRTVAHKYDSVCDDECNLCGAKRTPADHVFGNWKVVTEATETAEGKRERVCIVCGTVETEVIPATGSGSVSTGDTTTDAPDAPDTSDEPGDTTVAPDVGDDTTKSPETSDNAGEEDPGCGSFASAGILLVAILGSALVFKKRD